MKKLVIFPLCAIFLVGGCTPAKSKEIIPVKTEQTVINQERTKEIPEGFSYKGEKNTGFVALPDTFVPFIDSTYGGTEGMVQFGMGPFTILTLRQVGKGTVDQAAQAVRDGLKNQLGKTDGETKSEKATLDGLAAQKITVQVGPQTLTTWLVSDKEGTVYYVSMEAVTGEEEVYNKYVEKTYTLTI
ncbi:MAG: hypothetical protein ACRC6X_07980 [Culicoidibacterales bacterium]